MTTARYLVIRKNEVDSDGQVFDTDWLRAELARFIASDSPNLTVMFSRSVPPIGKVTGMSEDDDAIYVDVDLNDEPPFEPEAVGPGIARPRILRDEDAPNGRIVGGDLVQLSLVDRSVYSIGD